MVRSKNNVCLSWAEIALIKSSEAYSFEALVKMSTGFGAANQYGLFFEFCDETTAIKFYDFVECSWETDEESEAPDAD